MLLFAPATTAFITTSPPPSTGPACRRDKTKFKWKRNGLRHSFCSYRLAITQDAAKTSLEAGNSPQMIFRHYRELTTEDEAKEWFGILPPKQAENVVPLKIVANA